MANVLVDETSLQGIASAIRTKAQTQDTYTPSQMAQAINDLPSGGSQVVLPTYMSFAYMNTSANPGTVASFTQLPEWLETADWTYLKDARYMFAGTLMTSFSATNLSNFVPTQTSYMFKGANNALASVTGINMQNVTTAHGMFQGCSRLTTVSGLSVSNKLTGITDMFKSCSLLSSDSLNNILGMCANMTGVSSSDRNLKTLGLSSTQANTCTGLSNWSSAQAAGWITGY